VGFTDADLIERVRQAGDPNAFGELVRRYQSPVRGFLRKLTRGNEALADDLAQETFLRAWRKIESFRAEARFSTGLFGIAVNEFRGWLRRDRRRHGRASVLASPDGMDGTEDQGSRGRSPSHPAGPADADSDTGPAPTGLRLDLNEALLGLTLPERAAILLCCQQGLTHDEAARNLRTPVGTIKTNILRGKEKLRRWLQA
jgi:RNA polymerase sigma factor (sigma-70 family)